MDETLKVAALLGQTLTRLGVRWFVVGSLASSLHGVPRLTLDVDIVADLKPAQVRGLLKELGEAWYSDESAMRDAIANRSSFNLIHMDSAIKVDVFIPKLRRFDVTQFMRITRASTEEAEPAEFLVCSPEDIVIRKLEWFRIGGEISDRQWSDIIGVLKIKSGELNMGLLKDSADELGVADLLEKALREAGP